MSPARREVTRQILPKRAAAAEPPDFTVLFGAGALPYKLLEVPIVSIDVAPQVRVEFDPAEFATLLASVRELGLLTPVWLNRLPHADKFLLISGERRLRAATEAGLAAVPALVFENVPPDRVVELQLLENTIRAPLNSLDRSRGAAAVLAHRLGVAFEELPALLRHFSNVKNGVVERSEETLRLDEKLGSDPIDVAETTILTLVGERFQTFVRWRLPLLSLPKDLEAAYRQGEISVRTTVVLRGVEDARERADWLQKLRAGAIKPDQLPALLRAQRRASAGDVLEVASKAARLKRYLSPNAFSKLHRDVQKRLLDLLEEIEGA